MKLWGFLVRSVAACVVVTGLAFVVPTTPASAADPVKILIAGDSITVGLPGDFTWRYRLYNEFRRQNVPVDFVGPRRYPVGDENRYLVRSGWDMEHDAVTGIQLNQNLLSVATNVEQYQPHVLVAGYGTNDLVFGRTPDQIVADWRTYVGNARSAARKHGYGLKIILEELNSSTLPQRVELNQKLNALAAELSTPDEPVVVADVDFSGWDPKKHTYDGKHPSPTGELAIAQKIAYALKSIGVLGTPYIPWTSLQPWPPPLSAKMAVKAKTRQVSLQWGNAKANIRAQYMRVKFVPLTGSGRERRSGFSRNADMTTAKMAPGVYQVQLQARRGYMLSAWTAIGQVRIKPTAVRRR